MGGIAFVFSGQGDQYPGMGHTLYEQNDAAREVFDQCDHIRPGTTTQCFAGTAEELTQTRNTQPCMFALEMAGAAALRARGIHPDAVAGFSLGEVTAATVSGVCDMETGFRLVCRRGVLMQQAAEAYDTAMAAVVRLTPDQVMAICARFPDIYPVNYNCPGQISVAGLKAQMPDFMAEVRSAGGMAIPLKVAGAFHSPFMEASSAAFAAELAQVSLQEPQIPLYSNLTGEPYGSETTGTHGNTAADLLARQICHPVRWEQLIRNMITAGIDQFIEIGPGRTLTNMIHKIDPDVQAVTMDEEE